LIKELACIRRQRFDIPTLAFGIYRVERERRLAAARQAGDHDQRITRQLQRNVFEIVFARAADHHSVAECGSVAAIVGG